MTNPQNILALDPAACTGYMHTNGERGVWVITQGVKGDDHPGRRLVRLRNCIYQAYRDWGFDTIGYEDAAFGSPSRHVQALHDELRGVTKMVACELGARVIAVNPTQLKMLACGRPHASKAAVIRAAAVKLDVHTNDDNVADAAWVLAWVESGQWKHPSPMKARKRSRRKRDKGRTLFD